MCDAQTQAAAHVKARKTAPAGAHCGWLDLCPHFGVPPDIISIFTR
jgi:hypothetical protein